MHNVTLALELLKDEGLLTYPVSPEGECEHTWAVSLFPPGLGGSVCLCGCLSWCGWTMSIC